MARSTFSGPVRSLNGFITTGNNNAKAISSGTTNGATNIDDYQGKVCSITDQTAVFNLPEIVTDTGSDAQKKSPNTTSTIGYEYSFLVTESLTSSNTFTLNAGTAAGRSTADIFTGIAWYSNSATDPASNASWASGGADTLTIDATTRGGLVGTYITVKAIAANVWAIDARLSGNGTFVTPWS